MPVERRGVNRRRRAHAGGHSHAGNDAAGQGSNNSMLDKIRALKAMGYLRGNQDFEGMSQCESGVSGARVTTPSARSPRSIPTRGRS
jgi:hypothetical protein